MTHLCFVFFVRSSTFFFLCQPKLTVAFLYMFLLILPAKKMPVTVPTENYTHIVTQLRCNVD